MKVMIRENERGFLFRKGLFVKMLMPGEHRVWKIRDEACVKAIADGPVEMRGIELAVLLKDEAFAGSCARAQVGDNQLALHFVDGRLKDALGTGEYLFWNVFHQHTFELVDIRQPEISGLTAAQMRVIASSFYSKLEVESGSCGLLHYDGVFQKRLAPGTYYFWNGGLKVQAAVYDLRTQALELAGQEILTADKVMLRVNFACTYRITDPQALATEVRDHKTLLHTAVQLALREQIGRLRLDELLSQKEGAGAAVLARLREKEQALSVVFGEAGIKDIILPGEIRDIMNTVLIAEKRAQANVITRREEAASTRDMLNTAKLMDENGTLYKLKEMECLERICDKVGTISVGGGDLLGQLKGLLTAGR